jgi:sec-independent protein translocase protein TatA
MTLMIVAGRFDFSKIAHRRRPRTAEDMEMGITSIWHWIIVLLVVMLLFGRGRISDMMGDVAKGIKSFKKGLADDPEPETSAQATARMLELEAEKRAAAAHADSLAKEERKVG